MIEVEIRFPGGKHDTFKVTGLPKKGDTIILYDDPGSEKFWVVDVDDGDQPVKWVAPGYYSAPLKAQPLPKKPTLHLEAKK